MRHTKAFFAVAWRDSSGLAMQHFSLAKPFPLKGFGYTHANAKVSTIGRFKEATFAVIHNH